MARLDRAVLDGGVFPHRCEVIPRFSDLDRVGHLNNVAIADFLQEGRFRFCYDLGLAETTRHVVVASSTVEFAGDLFYPDRLEICTAVLDIGRTSFRIGLVVRQSGRIGVYAEAVQVVRDESGPIPIPDDWRATLESAKIK
jgi:acyl-CoA thioester hydrolase